MTHIGIVISTTRPTRVGDQVAEWIAAQAPEGVQTEIVDLQVEDLPFLAEPKKPAEGDYTLDTTRAWSERVSSFDGMILTVAEYNGGYTAQLKNAIDTLYAEWNDMPVGVVGYGWGGAARAVNALQPVLETVKAERIDGPGLSFTQHLSPEGDFLEAAPAAEVRELFEQIAAKVPATV